MIVIVSGTRSIPPNQADVLVAEAIRDSGYHVSAVYHGNSGSIDKAAGAWGEQHGIPVRVFDANWAQFGRRAGPIRNGEMLRAAQGTVFGVLDEVGLVAIRRGGYKSKGTTDMIERAKRVGIAYFVTEV